MELVFKQVRHGILCLLFAKSPLAAVSGDEFSSAAEVVDGQTAGVGTSAAFCHRCGVFQGTDVVDGEHGRSLALGVALPCDEGCSESAHDSGDIRTDRLAVGYLLKTPQDGIIIEGSALDHDVVSKLCCIGYFDDFEQGVLDDGVGESCGDVRHRSAFLLRLFYLGVHEHGTAGSQIDGVLRIECLVGKVFHRIVQGLREGLDERTAAGGTCLVELYAVHGLVLDLDTLHILSADIQDTVYVRLKERSGIVVGDGLYLALVQHQRCLDQRLAISGRAGVYDLHTLGKLAVDLLDRGDRGPQRIPFIVMIEGVEQGPVLAYQRGFGRGGTGVDPEESLPFICCKVLDRDLMFRVACGELLIVRC